jgi:6-phosphogluconate dehydrogenase
MICVKCRIASVLEREPEIENLLLSEEFSKELNENHKAWRRFVSLTVMAGCTAPTNTAALAYLDSSRCGRLSGALVQCLRDAMRGEGFERIDKEKGEMFSCRWSK